jgi:hypothetical protein
MNLMHFNVNVGRYQHKCVKDEIGSHSKQQISGSSSNRSRPSRVAACSCNPNFIGQLINLKDRHARCLSTNTTL